MSKTRRQQPDLLTIQAVLAYQRNLTLRADTAVARDPFADPYRPTEEAAKRLFYQCFKSVRLQDEEHRKANPRTEPRDPDELRSEAATLALETLATRARAKERERQADDLTAHRSLERHGRRQREAERDREQRRAGMSIGQRLDRAIAAFSVIPAASAGQIGHTTRGSERADIANHGDPGGEARAIALKAVRDVERLLDRHQLRDVSKAA